MNKYSSVGRVCGKIHASERSSWGKCITEHFREFKVELNVEKRERRFLMVFYAKKKERKRLWGTESVVSVPVGQREFTVYLTDQIDTRGAKKKKNM